MVRRNAHWGRMLVFYDGPVSIDPASMSPTKKFIGKSKEYDQGRNSERKINAEFGIEIVLPRPTRSIYLQHMPNQLFLTSHEIHFLECAKRHLLPHIVNIYKLPVRRYASVP